MASKSTLAIRNLPGPKQRLLYDSGVRLSLDGRTRERKPRLIGAYAKQRWFIAEDGSLRLKYGSRIGKAAKKAQKREKRRQLL